MEYHRPQITPKIPINRRLIERVIHATFEGQHESPHHPDVTMSTKDLVSKLVVLKAPDGVMHRTWLNEDWLPNGVDVKVGDNIVIRTPVPNSIGMKEDHIGVIVRIDDPVGFEWLQTAIKAGNVPQILREVALTFDVDCSAMSVIDLGGTIWRWPKFADIDPMSGLAKLADPDVPLRRRAIPLTHKIPTRSDTELNVVHALANQHETAIHQSCEVIELAETLMMMLPMATMVTSTVTKSVLEWRAWLKTAPNTYEGAFLRDQFYKYLLDAMQPMFFDCSAASDNLKRYREENKV